MRLASFDVPFSKGVDDLSIMSLSGSSGGLLANVSRWRGQVELDPISESDILTTSSVGESKMGPYRIFKMINEKKKRRQLLRLYFLQVRKPFSLNLRQIFRVELEFSFKNFAPL